VPRAVTGVAVNVFENYITVYSKFFKFHFGDGMFQKKSSADSRA